MAVDPVCHMKVDESTDFTVEQNGETFYFCSEHCRNLFLEQKEAQADSEKAKDN